MPHRVAAATTIVVVVAAAGMSAAQTATTTHTHRHGQRITVGQSTCAAHWHAPNPGRAHFVVRNTSHRRATVYFFHAISNKIAGRVPHLAPHKSQELVVHVKAGDSYLWGCELHGMPRHISEAQTVPVDPVRGGHGPRVPPVQADVLTPALKTYRGYVRNLIAKLQTQLDSLTTAIGGDDQAAAEAAWLTAHLTWLRIGQDDGAYGAFGALGSQIDGTAAGLQHGTSSPAFTGFHKVELDLWANDLSAAATDAATLRTLVRRLANRSLIKQLPPTRAGVTDWTLRCHEVLEDALRDSLSGDDDYGSGTDLASVTADVSATHELLGLLAPFIGPRSPHLVHKARGRLRRLMAQARASRRDGSWVSVADLPRRERERVDAAAGAAAETLAPIPDLLRIGNT
jgi:iron uptake system EfeUOB component EfeO/EfeM